jgi:hypothetical protein
MAHMSLDSTTIASSCMRSVSSVVEPGNSWREAFRRAAGPWHEAERRYVEAVLGRYLWLPVSPAGLGRQDRRCARALYARGVSLEVVEGALLLAAARRTFRPKDADPLRPIQALHYFLPAIEELQQTGLRPGYAEYLISRLRPFAEAKGRLVNAG